jgi:hypothetical protein
MSEALGLTRSTTQRGFAIFTFRDLYGLGCSIQKSSLADKDAIWVGVDNPTPKVLASEIGRVNPETGEMSGWVDYPMPENVLIRSRMHLTQEQVAALLPILQAFAATGELPEEFSSDVK